MVSLSSLPVSAEPLISLVSYALACVSARSFTVYALLDLVNQTFSGDSCIGKAFFGERDTTFYNYDRAIS